MKAMIQLMALAIHNDEYKMNRVPLRLKEQVEKEYAKLKEGDE